MPKRESKYVRVARIAYQVCKRTLPRYSHPKSPHRFTLPQRTACVLLMFYVRKSYRDMEEWLLASESLCRELELPEVPDHTTLSRIYRRLGLGWLNKLQDTLLQELRPQEEAIAFDTTGFSPTQASLHYLARCRRRYEQYYKGAYAVGVNSQLIVAAVSGLGPGADTIFLEPLRRRARRYAKTRHWAILADSGFDSQTVRRGDIIPPIRRGGVMKLPERIARLERVSAARLDGLYGQRWKVETANSVIKRKFGNDIRSRKPAHRSREPIVKGLIYNIHI